MLQSPVRSQLARIKLQMNQIQKKISMIPSDIGPTKYLLHGVIKEVEYIGPYKKHWFTGGLRSISAAAIFLRQEHVIAMPTDTVYGLACSAQCDQAIQKIYRIKQRDEQKPLAISLASVADIATWAETEHLPETLLPSILPGAVTVVLKRKPALNPNLNPGNPNVGIRVPVLKFPRTVARMLNAPIALTSANESNKPSSLTPEEFQKLWPSLRAIFYGIKNSKLRNEHRVGSTVVDLTIPGKYKILRKGVDYKRLIEQFEAHDMCDLDR